MSKKIIIFTSIIVIIIISFIIFITFLRKDKEVINVISEFPFFDIVPDDSGVSFPKNDTGGVDIIDGKESKIPALRKITDEAVAGAVVLSLKNSEGIDETSIKYIERATGHIYQTSANKINEERISNTTIPKIYEAFWGVKGDRVITRFLDKDTGEIETFSAEIVVLEEEGAESPNIIQGTFLPRSIDSLSFSPSLNKLFYLTKTDSGVVGNTINMDNTNKRQIFSSEFSEWLPQWITKNVISLTTKPSRDVFGYTYFLNTITGSFNKILGGVKGLTTLISPDGNKILFSESQSKQFVLKMYDIQKDSIEQIFLDTLPEKCVWSKNSDILFCGIPDIIPNNIYPDDWYQGLSSFSDTIWMIDIDSGVFESLIELEKVSGIEIDLIKPTLSPQEDYLIFTNKNDMTLWSYRLEN